MPAIHYVSPFVPAEWVAAHGFTPVRLLPVTAGPGPLLGPLEGLCPYARAFANAWGAQRSASCQLAPRNLAGCATKAAPAAVIVATTCDQMRRVSEFLAGAGRPPVFTLNVPATWQTSGAQQMYLDELKRLGRFLVRLGAAAPSDARLAEVMREWDAQREAARAARSRMTGRAYAEALAELHRTGLFPTPPASAPLLLQGARLALIGGPLLGEDLWLYDLIEDSGGRVVLDGTETGERALPPPFDRRSLRDAPLVELAAAYFGRLPDAFRRPNSQLYAWLKQEFSARGVRGVLFVRELWCDLWHAEATRLREWCGLPFAELDFGGGGDTRGRAATRVQTLLGMLE
jgi:benzoyl-CoA reductase/2-hydroxyglutaryl-CoA dehydratase subunit BcrC/BadD/HgdB